MTVSADSHKSVFVSTDVALVDPNSGGFLPTLGAELAFIQDAAGKYLSFYWEQAQNQGLTQDIVIQESLEQTFTPVEIEPYLAWVQRVLKSLVPERQQCRFRYQQTYFDFELIISPILPKTGNATKALVMGRQKTEVETESLSHVHPIPENVQPLALETQSKQLLSQISRNIRRTLDLDTIWQQTVESLATALSVDKCIICSYKSDRSQVQVVGEYCHEPVVLPMLGLELSIENEPALAEAVETLKPVVVEQSQSAYFQQQSLLVIATCYQQQPNGLIIIIGTSAAELEHNGLRQKYKAHERTPEEIELIKELADQAGTAIAHATLYKDLEEARQQAEAASRHKSEFLANTSHELRTPLNGMLGFLKLVLEGMADDPQEQLEFINEAYRSAIHLLQIINDILDIAKIEAGKMELELGPVKLSELFHHLEGFTRTQAEAKNLSLVIQKPETSDEIIVQGNYQRLLQVLLNLTGNAIKFTHEGGVTITTDVVRKKLVFHNQELPGMVKLRVADTGVGVSLDQQDKLFQSFSQVDGSRTRQYGGTGLGLTISQKLVEAMGGTVNFYSMGEGLGSTVTFTVPLYQEPLMVGTQTIEDS